jgi:hypothetical protein
MHGSDQHGRTGTCSPGARGIYADRAAGGRGDHRAADLDPVAGAGERAGAGKKAKCGANLHSIGQAVANCWAQYNDFGPSWDDGGANPSPGTEWYLFSWADTLFDLGFLGNPDAQICPSDQQPDEVVKLRTHDRRLEL